MERAIATAAEPREKGKEAPPGKSETYRTADGGAAGEKKLEERHVRGTCFRKRQEPPVLL